MKHATIRTAFGAALSASIPVMAGYVFLGSAYGVLMHNLGYGPFWTAVMSALVFGGTIQFIATVLLASGFQPLYAFLTSVLINARHLFYGFSMLPRYAGTGWKKPLLIFWLTDETFALVCSDDTPPGADPAWFRLFVSGLDYLYWIAGGLLGNAAGSLFAFNARGIEFVMTSLFTVIVIAQWRAAKTHAPALIGLAASVLCLLAFGAHYFIVPAMIAIVVSLLIGRGSLQCSTSRGEEEEARP